MATPFMSLVNNLLRRLNEVELEEADFDGARGVQAMAKDAINASIEFINQAEFTWPFNAAEGEQVLVAGQEDYNWPDNYKVGNWQSFHVQRDDTLSENGHPLTFISRNLWLKKRKQEDDYSGADGLSSPMWVFEKHGTGFSVSPTPDAAYTVTFEYWILNTALVEFDDESSIPTNFDEVIIQGGLYHFYMFRDNAEQAMIAEKRFDRQLSDMRTLLINKEDRVYGSMITSRRSRGSFSIPVDGWYM